MAHPDEIRHMAHPGEIRHMAHSGEIRHLAHLFAYLREVTRYFSHVLSLNIEPIFNIEAMNSSRLPTPSPQPQFRRASITKQLPLSASLRTRVSCVITF